MVFQTFDTTYTVIHSGKSNMQMPIYLCKDESDGELYRIFGMEKRFLADETIFFLQEQLRKSEFTDFKDIFIYESSMYIAMRYYSAPTLKMLMAQEEFCEWEERYELGRKLLEQLILTKMPVYFCCHCLEAENILITQSLDIHFSYGLDDIEVAPVMTRQMYWNSLADFFTYLWDKELKQECVPQIKEFLLFLKKEEEKTDEEIYRMYLELSSILTELPKEERNRPRRKLFILWDKFKKGIPIVKRILAYMILLAVLGYFIYTVWETNQPDGEQMDQISYIGSLKIRK